MQLLYTVRGSAKALPGFRTLRKCDHHQPSCPSKGLLGYRMYASVNWQRCLVRHVEQAMLPYVYQKRFSSIAVNFGDVDLGTIKPLTVLYQQEEGTTTVLEQKCGLQVSPKQEREPYERSTPLQSLSCGEIRGCCSCSARRSFCCR